MSNLIYQKFLFLYLAAFLNCHLKLQQKDFAFDVSLNATVLLNLIHKRFQKIFSQGLPIIFYPWLWSFSWGPDNRNRVLPWLPWSCAELHQLSLCPLYYN